jgi:hypothetical protein
VDERGPLQLTLREKPREVRVSRDQYPSLACGEAQDLFVSRRRQSEFADVSNVVAVDPE